jgi:hypothetical protein
MGQKNSDWLDFQTNFFFKILIYFLKINAKFIKPWSQKVGIGWFVLHIFFSSMIHGNLTC